MLPLGQGHKAGGRASVSAQVLLTSHFLSREQYKMLLGSKCQMSRTDSCSAGEEGGAKGCWRPSQPRALSWAGMAGRLLCLSRSSEIQDHDRWSLATLSLTGDTCGAPRSPTWEINNYQRLRSFLGQGIVVQALLGVVVPASSGCQVGESAPWCFRPWSA